MTEPAPGPAPDRAAAEQRLRIAKGTLRALTSYRGAPDFREDVEAVLAELDRQRVIMRAAEALVECDAAKPGLGQSISLWRRQRRELLDTLAAAVRAEGEGQ